MQQFADISTVILCLQVEVTFDLDANGILHVTAVETATRKAGNIVITNDKGRLNRTQIEAMVAEAEKFRDQDARTRAAVEARNDLESYIYNARRVVEDPATSSRFTDAERATIVDATESALAWVHANPNAEESEYRNRLKEIEGRCKEIIMRIFTSAYPDLMSSDRRFPRPGGRNNEPGIDDSD